MQLDAKGKLAYHKNMDIRRIDYNEFAAVYKEHLVRDFPFVERRPLALIKKQYENGQYSAYLLEDGQELVAYASFLGAEGVESELLDYFAVVPKKRARGVGSGFLQQLAEGRDTAGILLECETPRTAGSNEEYTLRKRRIEFYKRLGAQLTPWVWHAFTVEYALLWLPAQKQLCEGTPDKDIQAIYSTSLPGALAKAMTKIWREEGAAEAPRNTREDPE